jgi:hypothetical protein
VLARNEKTRSGTIHAVGARSRPLMIDQFEEILLFGIDFPGQPSPA